MSVIPLVSPIDSLSDDYLLSVHMLEHVLLGDAGPALIVCALRGPLLVFMLPPFLLARSRVHGPSETASDSSRGRGSAWSSGRS